ncbi:unnamed protein product, partial [marine sediment metagenome]
MCKKESIEKAFDMLKQREGYPYQLYYKGGSVAEKI